MNTQEYARGSPFGSDAVAVKVTLALVATLVLLALTERVGARFPGASPVWTYTSIEGGVVAFFAMGVMWMPVSGSLNVRPIQSAESLRVSVMPLPNDPGVMSRSWAPPLLPFPGLPPLPPMLPCPQRSQVSIRPFMKPVLVVCSCRNSAQ